MTTILVNGLENETAFDSDSAAARLILDFLIDEIGPDRAPCLIIQALRELDWDEVKAAEDLGISLNGIRQGRSRFIRLAKQKAARGHIVRLHEMFLSLRPDAEGSGSVPALGI